MKEKLLSDKEAAKMLNLPLVKIQRWVHQGKIPCKYKAGVCCFKPEEIRSWAEEHSIHIPPQQSSARTAHEQPGGLVQAVSRGGFYFDVAGRDIFEVFKNSVQKMSFLGDKIEPTLEALLDREEIASTGIGKEVAIPHPRKVLPLGLSTPVIPVCFLKNPVDFGSVDGLPVRFLFFMFSPDTKIHLDMLSRLSFCLRSPRFFKALNHPQDGSPVLKAVQDIEARFRKN